MTTITVEDALNGILDRYPSGTARIQRLFYFAQHGATNAAAAAAASTNEDAVMADAGGGGDDASLLSVGECIQKAYRAIAETCKKEGNVVRYKLIFGHAGNNAKSPPPPISAGNPEETAAAASGNADGDASMAASSSTNGQQQQQQQQNVADDDDGKQQAASESSNKNNAAAAVIMDVVGDGESSSLSNNNNNNATNANTATVIHTTGILYDSLWAEDYEQQARTHRDVLEHRLLQAQQQLHKESIRTAFLALAAAPGGDLPAALHALLRAKDYCTSKQQTVQVCLQIVSTALAIGSTQTAAEYIHKLQHTLNANTSSAGGGAQASQAAASASASGTTAAAAAPPTHSTELDRILVQTAAGLERLAVGEFRTALTHFLQVVQHEELETAFASVAFCANPGAATTAANANSVSAAAQASPSQQSPQAIYHLPYWVSSTEVSLYAAVLCLLFGTPQQRLALADHVSALEPVPLLQSHVLLAFCQARYDECFDCLANTVHALLATDLYLGPHLPQLLQGVRQHALRQYWRPYQCVPLTTMQTDLGTRLVPSLDALRREWMDMILQEQQQPSQSQGDGSGSGKESGAKDASSKWVLSRITGDSLADTRLDGATDTLHRISPNSDTTTTAQQQQQQQQQQAKKLSQLTKQVLDDSYAMTIRLACQEMDCTVVNVDAGGGRGGGNPEEARFWRAQQQQQRGGGGGRSRSGGGHRGGGGGGVPILDDVVVAMDDEDDEDEDELHMFGGGGGGAMLGGAAAGAGDADTAMVDAMNPEDLY